MAGYRELHRSKRVFAKTKDRWQATGSAATANQFADFLPLFCLVQHINLPCVYDLGLTGKFSLSVYNFTSSLQIFLGSSGCGLGHAIKIV
jgi:hypothetical protein